MAIQIFQNPKNVKVNLVLGLALPKSIGDEWSHMKNLISCRQGQKTETGQPNK